MDELSARARGVSTGRCGPSHKWAGRSSRSFSLSQTLRSTVSTISSRDDAPAVSRRAVRCGNLQCFLPLFRRLRGQLTRSASVPPNWRYGDYQRHSLVFANGEWAPDDRGAARRVLAKVWNCVRLHTEPRIPHERASPHVGTTAIHPVDHPQAAVRLEVGSPAIICEASS